MRLVGCHPIPVKCDCAVVFEFQGDIGIIGHPLSLCGKDIKLKCSSRGGLPFDHNPEGLAWVLRFYCVEDNRYIIVPGTAYNGSGGANRANDKVAELSILFIFNVAVEKSEACSRFNTVRSAGEKCDFPPTSLWPSTKA
jgi:hypothetical protein